MKSQKTQLRLHCIVSLFALVYLTSKRLSNVSILVSLAENGNKLLDLDDGSILGSPQRLQ